MEHSVYDRVLPCQKALIQETIIGIIPLRYTIFEVFPLIIQTLPNKGKIQLTSGRLDIQNIRTRFHLLQEIARDYS